MRTSARLITYFAAGLLAVASLSPPPAFASPQFVWSSILMRNTAASTVESNPNWAANSGASGFADTIGVFRRGAATETLVDTTGAIIMSRFAPPPSFINRPGAAVDTVDQAPWIMVRVRQDSTSYSFSGTTGLDSALVAAQYSYDGINWLNVQGTPTRAFLAVTIPTAGDGTQPPALTLAENNPGADAVTFAFQYQPFLNPNSPIINRNLFTAGTFVRFLIGVLDGSGQFHAEVGEWKY